MSPAHRRVVGRRDGRGGRSPDRGTSSSRISKGCRYLARGQATTRPLRSSDDRHRPSPATCAVRSPAPPAGGVSGRHGVDRHRLATVEQQLTAYFASIATQANATRVAAESARQEARHDLETLASTLHGAIERLTTQSLEDRKALRLALDNRLAEVGAHQEWRFTELEARLESVAQEAHGVAGAPAGAAIDPAVVDQRIGQALGPIAARLDALVAQVGQSTEHIRRLDANGAALAQQVTQVAAVVDSQGSQALDQRLAELRTQIGQTLGTFRTDVDNALGATRSTVDGALTALRADLDEAVSERVGDLESQVAALRGGVDQTLAALSSRMTEIEGGHAATSDRLTRIEQVTSKVDPTEIEHLREKMQTAIGEAVLMRIEMDRLSGSLDERFDSVRVRLSEVEAQVADNMDVSAAVQLERLEELERAVMFLTPADSPARHVAAVPTQQPAPVHLVSSAPGVPAPPAMSVVPPPPAVSQPAMATVPPPPPGVSTVSPGPVPSSAVPPPRPRRPAPFRRPPPGPWSPSPERPDPTRSIDPSRSH